MHHLIPGRAQGKSFLFLVVLSRENSHPKWVELLQQEGYGGSVMVSTVSFMVAEQALMSGTVDAILMWDADMFSKAYRIEEIFHKLRRDRIPEPPFYHFEDPVHLEWAVIPLHDFLVAYCPRT